jgi:hypothetical protein
MEQRTRYSVYQSLTIHLQWLLDMNTVNVMYRNLLTFP